MDGLRLALIIAGVVVVALVYFWTSRRRRLEREAGDFDRFGAWADQNLDPLVDPEENTQPNLRVPPLPERSRPPVEPSSGTPPPAPGPAPSAAAPGDGLAGSKVLEGLEAIAMSLDTRTEPRLGTLDEVDARPPARPAPSAPPARPAAPPPPKPARGPAARPPPDRAEPRREAQPQGGESDLVVVLNVMAPEGERFAGPAVRDALESAGLAPGEMQLYHYRAEAQPADSPAIFSALNAVKPGTLDPAELEQLQTPGIALVLRLHGLDRPSEAFELMHGAAVRIAQELGGRLCDETRSTLTRQALNHLRERITDAVRRRRLGG